MTAEQNDGKLEGIKQKKLDKLSTILHHRKWSVDQQKPNFWTNDKFYSLIYTCEK
jgi:hypothetical protein